MKSPSCENKTMSLSMFNLWSILPPKNAKKPEINISITAVRTKAVLAKNDLIIAINAVIIYPHQMEANSLASCQY